MKDILERNLEMLREKIERNTHIINENRIVLNEVIQMPVSEERTHLFTSHFGQNNELFSLNYKIIKLQSELRRTLQQKDGLKTFGKMSLS